MKIQYWPHGRSVLITLFYISSYVLLPPLRKLYLTNITNNLEDVEAQRRSTTVTITGWAIAVETRSTMRPIIAISE